MNSAAGRNDLMSRGDAKDLLAEALGLTRDALPDDARIGELKGWDSLAHTRLLLAIEERLQRELDSEVAATIESLHDIDMVLKQ